MNTMTLSLLQLFSERSMLSLSDLSVMLNIDALNLASPIKYMLQENFIKVESISSKLEGDAIPLNQNFIITHLGRATLEMELKSKKTYKYKEIRSWVTLAIAVLAFIKSFFC